MCGQIFLPWGRGLKIHELPNRCLTIKVPVPPFIGTVTNEIFEVGFFHVIIGPGS